MKQGNITRCSLSLALILGVSGCGGGGSEEDLNSGGEAADPDAQATPAGALHGALIDLPVEGLLFSASPSGLAGTTASGGRYRYLPGDTVAFDLPTGAAPLPLLTRSHADDAGSTGTLVTSLENGQAAAEIVRALDHGADGRLQVGGLAVPADLGARIGAYVASGGSELAGLPSNDAFLRHLQQGVQGPAPFAVPVTGASDDFLLEVVLPDLQDAAADAPGPATGDAGVGLLESKARAARTFRLSGSMIHSGSIRLQQVPGCTVQTVSFKGGGILNLTVRGDIRRRGTYDGQFAAGSYRHTIDISAVTCTSGSASFTIPRKVTTKIERPTSGNFTVTSDGKKLRIPGRLGVLPPGCSGTPGWTGTQVGVANAMATLRMSLNCTIGGSRMKTTFTVKVVGVP